MFKKFVSLKIIPLRSLRLCGELLLLLLCVAALVIPCCAASASTWHIEAVDAPKYFNQSSIKVDTNGTVHIAYGGDHLYYATYDGSAWSYQTVDSNSSVGWFSSLALDSSGKAHLVYYDSSRGDLKYATNLSGVWVTTTVDDSFYLNDGSISIALDGSDKVHISYHDQSYGSYGELKYTTNASGAWITRTVDGNVGSSDGYSSIALDTSGKAHISYYDSTSGYLKYATNALGLWVTTTVDSSGDVGRCTSIALDSSDKAYISYFDWSNATLKYATNASGAWVTATVRSDIGTSQDYTSTSIVIDNKGNAHISYSSLNRPTWYATNAFGVWETTQINSSVYNSSIALDSKGMVYISYYDYWFNLNYATNASGSWVKTSVDSAEYAGYSASLALDGKGKTHISYLSFSDFVTYLKYATNASGEWRTTTVDNGTSYDEKNTSIALDNNGDVHIAYLGSSNNYVKYATNISGEWVTTTVSKKGGEYPSIAVGSAGNVHISYCDGDKGYLQYATNASGSWVTSTVDKSGGDFTSIAVDSKGKAHISYCRLNKKKLMLKYATNTSGTWKTKIVDVTKGTYSWGTSIALSSKGKVHISYFDNKKQRLKYATNVSGKWVKKIIGSEYFGMFSSISIDGDDKIHISSMTGSYGLMYATNASGEWVTETIDDYGLACRDTAIGVDSSGNSHIAYYDYFSNKDLKYATNATDSTDTDTTAPNGSISIVNENYTNTTSISLILMATDDYGVSGYYLSESSSIPSASASGWTSVTKTTNYSASTDYTLSSGDGPKNIYAWFKDEAGNVSTTASNSITLDTTNGEATPTPTPTPATSPSPTPTPAASPTPTMVTTPTPAPTTSPTPTPTPATTPSPAVSPSPAASPSPTPTATQTPVPTPSATPTPTPTTGGSGIVFGFVYNVEEVKMQGVTVTIGGIADGSSQDTETDTRGFYVFRNLAARSYTLTYEKEDYQEQTVTVSLDEGEVKEIDDVSMEEVVKGKIWGYVKDINGEPVESVILSLEGIKTGITDSDSSDKDGFFEIANLDADKYTIIAWKKRYRQATKTVTIGDGESKEIEIEMRRTTKRIKKLHSAGF